MTIRTFSIVGRSADGSQLGVAVASKFLAVGAYVPAASLHGALATQAMGNMELRSRGLRLLADGVQPKALLEQFFATDSLAAERQAGVVDALGRVATYTGEKCMPWAGGRAEEDPAGSFAVQGNMLTGPEVLDAMVDVWRETAEQSLSIRLVQALVAGQAAGGDPRGKQAASLLVVGEGQGYGGLSDVAVDLRVDDAPDPIGELQRMLGLHELYFGSTPEAELVSLDNTLLAELEPLLARAGFASGDVAADLYKWMGRENYEERWHDGTIDPVVLELLRDDSSKG
jgi:uncharacterized Ntn-hydrolase superfamily protein